MKILLSIVMFAFICIDPVCTDDELDTNDTLDSGSKYLKCHVCRGTFQCYSPTTCKDDEKFCMIVEFDYTKMKQKSQKQIEDRVVKYCSVSCPLIQYYYGRTTPSYVACCAYDLCNYKKLSRGSRLCGSVPVVAIAFVVSFLGTLRNGL